MLKHVLRNWAAASALAVCAATAQAGAVITHGATSLGVNDTAELNFWGYGPGGWRTYGVYRHGVGDAISPGCPCEGWGVAVTIGTREELRPIYDVIHDQGTWTGGAGGGTWASYDPTGPSGTWVVTEGDLGFSATGTWSFADGVRGYEWVGYPVNIASFDGDGSGDTPPTATPIWSFGVYPEGSMGWLSGQYSYDASADTLEGVYTLEHLLHVGDEIVVVDNRIAGFANQAVGHGGLTGGVFGATGSTATSILGLADYPIQVAHYYGPSLVSDVFQVQVSIANLGDATVQDLVYRRVMDWDVPPTEFFEYVTHGGVEANLESAGGNVRYASNNGFVSGDPRIDPGEISPPGGSVNRDFTDLGPADHGSVFDFAFGDLAPGATRIFNIYYGSAENTASALAKIAALGAEVWSIGKSTGNSPANDRAVFFFAFGGVGGTEPGMTPEEPVMPFVPAPGVMEFPAPQPRRWFDPPFADGFEYELHGGDHFLAVAPPPAHFGFGPVDLYIGGSLIASLAPGAIYDFILGGHGSVTKFALKGITPLLDTADPGFTTAFPTYLDFTTTFGSSLTMTALLHSPPPPPPPGVPEPGVLLLLGVGLLGLAASRYRRV